jgi:hypothetical protein
MNELELLINNLTVEKEIIEKEINRLTIKPLKLTNKQRYDRNKKNILQQQKEYYQRNKEKIIKRNIKWQSKNLEKVKQYKLKYYVKNK